VLIHRPLNYLPLLSCLCATYAWRLWYQRYCASLTILLMLAGARRLRTPCTKWISEFCTIFCYRLSVDVPVARLVVDPERAILVVVFPVKVGRSTPGIAVAGVLLPVNVVVVGTFAVLLTMSLTFCPNLSTCCSILALLWNSYSLIVLSLVYVVLFSLMSFWSPKSRCWKLDRRLYHRR
jgi:hypothetical protein